MSNIIIGNTIGFIASLVMVYTGIIKKKKKIIKIQTLQLALFTLSNLVLDGISGAIVNSFSILRNYLAYKNKLTLKIKLFIISLTTTFTLIFDDISFISILPILATTIYTLYIDTKSIKKLKIVLIINALFWLIYDISIKLYVSCIFDILCILANLTSLFLIKKNKHHKK